MYKLWKKIYGTSGHLAGPVEFILSAVIIGLLALAIIFVPGIIEQIFKGG